MTVSVRQVIEVLLQPAAPVENTVDQLLFGQPDMPVKGIAATFLASHAVLEQAAALGANLVISHEGLFYSHRPNPQLTEGNSVYADKLEFIEANRLAVYRFHDHVHRYQPDEITQGLVDALGWREAVAEMLPTAAIVQVPRTRLKELLTDIKRKLDLPYVRFIGDLTMNCGRIGILVGYRGGGNPAIPLFESRNLDLVIAGEGPEWETPEYVRDALHQGRNRGLVLLGHAASEIPGMRRLAERLQEHFPRVPVHVITESSPIRVG